MMNRRLMLSRQPRHLVSWCLANVMVFLALLLLLCERIELSHAIETSATIARHETTTGSSSNSRGFFLRGQQQRKLQSNKQECPQNSTRFCDDPNNIMYDPTVYCDFDTCRWDISRLSPDRKPSVCQSIAITNVDQLDDYLEPCLWWEMLFGDLRPTASPTITPQPTITPYPTVAPSVTASPAVALLHNTMSPTSAIFDDAMISGAPTAGPSVAATEVTPTKSPTAQSSSWSSNSNTTASSSSWTSSTSSSTLGGWLEIDTILLTFLIPVDPPSTSKKPSSSLRTLSSSVYATIDRGQLLYVATDHLKNELATKVNTIRGGVATTNATTVDVRLIVTPVSTSTNPTDSTSSGSSGSTTTMIGNTTLVSVSEALDGRVRFASSIEKQIRSGILQQFIEQAFEGDAMDRFLQLLQQSNDPTLRQVDIVYKGLPSDAPSTLTGSSSATDQDDDEPFFEWNQFWIVMVAGAGVGAIAFTIMLYCLCYKWCTVGCGGKGGGKKALDLDPTKSSDTQGAATDSSDDQKSPTGSATNAQEEAEENAAVLESDRPEERHFNPFDDSILSGDDDGSSLVSGHYQPSEITSVYSYIEEGNTTMIDDQSYSIAPSMMYNDRLAMTDDQSIQSRMWSVADGVTGDPNNNHSKLNLMLMSSTLGGGPGTESGRMLVFADGDAGDDDDISMVSDGVAPTPRTDHLRPKVDNKASSAAAAESMLKRQDTGRSSPTNEQPGEPSLKDRAAVDAILSKKNPSILPFVGVTRVGDDDDDSASEASYGPSALDTNSNNKNNDTLNGSTVTKVSKGSLGVSVRVRKSKENLMNNRAIIAALGESTSDDDSSLFMGPTDLVGQGSHLVPLSAKDKIDTSTNDEFRFGPLPRGGQRLTDKEKKHLQLGVNPTELQSGNESSSSPSFVLPSNYSAIAAEEKKDDDGNISTLGSTPQGNGGKYTIDSMASF